MQSNVCKNGVPAVVRIPDLFKLFFYLLNIDV